MKYLMYGFLAGFYAAEKVWRLVGKIDCTEALDNAWDEGYMGIVSEKQNAEKELAELLEGM